MLSKKHTDVLHWKNKLEALHALPEQFATGKELMWEKLHDRLQKKPAGNKIGWYWLAAAFIPFVIITLTMMSKDHHVFVKQEKLKELKRTILQPSTKESVTVYNTVPVEKVRTANDGKVKNYIPADTMNVKEIIVSHATLQEDLKAEQIIIKADAPDSNTTPATISAKKKLQVVHINELESLPAQFNEPVNYAQNLLDKKTKKNKVNNFTIANQQNSIGFKIKLSSKN